MKLTSRAWWFDMAALIAVVIAMIVCDRLCHGGDPTIIWPRSPTYVEPIQPPAPIDQSARDIDTLKAEEWLVVESSAELIIRKFPDGIIDVESTTGPIRVRGRFADGNGKIETREYRTAYVYFLTSAKSGVVGIDLIPVGLTTETSIARHILTVVDGTQPNPPPKPEPGPGPKPDPPKPEPEPQPVAKNVSLAIIEDTMNRPPSMAILMNSLVAWTEFTDSGNDWRAYDIRTKEARGRRAMTDCQDVPGLVVYSNDAARRKLFAGPMPATIEELKALVGRLTGG